MTRVLAAALVLLVPAVARAQSGEDSNAAARFVRDVALDYKNFLSIDTAQWLGVGGIAAGTVHAADELFYEDTQDVQPTPIAVSVGQKMGELTYQVPFALGFWVVGGLAGSRRAADAGRDLVRAQISAFSWTYAFKYAVNRTRPNGDPRSFPSGHASATFATAMVLQEHYGWKIGVPALAVAGYTATSRVFDNKHWASDVVFGATLGMACARTVTFHLRETRVSLALIALPGGGGFVAEINR